MGAIRDVTATPLDIPLVRPFTIAVGRQTVARNVLVTVTLEDGTTGLGEAAPFVELTGETQETCLAAIASVKGLLVGRDVRSWRALSAALAGAIRAQTSARAGIETAILDAFGQVAAMPLYQLFGGVACEVSTDMTIPIVDPATARELALEVASRGISIIKTKVGSTPEADIERVFTIARTVPAARLVLDANQGFTPRAAVRFLERLKTFSIEPILYEQPVARTDLVGMRFVRERVHVPVAADESVSGPADAMAVVAAQAADVINIKLMKSGGLVDALAIASIARCANVGLMIGGMIESRVGMNAAAHLAAGLGGFEFVDLDTHMLLAEDPFDGGFRQDGARLVLDGIERGAGIRRRPARRRRSP